MGDEERRVDYASKPDSRSLSMKLAIPICVLAAAMLAGCYEEQAPAPQYSQQQPTPQQPPQQQGGIDTMQRPSQAGAKRAAQNTVDRVAQHQQEIEKAIEDQP